MHHRLIAIFALLCFAFGGAGCESLYRASLPKPKPPKKKKVQPERKRYESVVMPLQTGSTLQRRMFVEKKADEDDPEPKKKPKKKESPTPTPTPKPAVEPADTPPPPEEATPEPTPERFR